MRKGDNLNYLGRLEQSQFFSGTKMSIGLGIGVLLNQQLHNSMTGSVVLNHVPVLFVKTIYEVL